MGRGFNVRIRKAPAVRFQPSQTSPPAYRRFRVTSDAEPPGLVPIYLCLPVNKSLSPTDQVIPWEVPHVPPQEGPLVLGNKRVPAHAPLPVAEHGRYLIPVVFFKNIQGRNRVRIFWDHVIKVPEISLVNFNNLPAWFRQSSLVPGRSGEAPYHGSARRSARFQYRSKHDSLQD